MVMKGQVLFKVMVANPEFYLSNEGIYDYKLII